MARERDAETRAKAAGELDMIELMVKIYCHGNGHSKRGELCPDCKELLEYSAARIDKCPRMEEKTFCSTCPVHCYKRDMRERVREVMRYSGPRMLLHRPVPAIRHCVNTIKARRAAKTA